MSWRPAKQRDLPALIELLKRREWENMHFSSRIYNNGNPRLPARKHKLWVLEDRQKDLKAAILLWDHCQLFPLFPPEGLSLPELHEILQRLDYRALFSLLGPQGAVDALLQEMTLQPMDSLLYRLLVLHGPVQGAGSAAIPIDQAELSDLNCLMPLEIAYQKEEVVRNPERLNVKYVKRLFSNQLKEQLVLYGEQNGEVLTKGGTNARGFIYHQLGGIYTHEEHRGKGLALELLAELCRRIEMEQRHSCLFVKEHNAAARRLYEKAGFQDRGSFKICYFFR